MLPDQFKCLCKLFIGNILCTAENDRACKFDLVVVELAEVLHIAFYFRSISYCDKAVQNNIFTCNALYCIDHIGKLADT